MPIELICPQCSKAYKLPDNLAGKKVRCKDCSTKVEVPSAAEVQPDEEHEFAGLLDDDEDIEMPEPLPRMRKPKTVAAHPKKKSPPKQAQVNGLSFLDEIWPILKLAGIVLLFGLGIWGRVSRSVNRAQYNQKANQSQELFVTPANTEDQ
jgi:hypothetical protein